MRLVPCTSPRNTCKKTQITKSNTAETHTVALTSSWRNIYLGEPRDVQHFPVLDRGLTGLARPRSFALAVSEARPGEDIMVGQVQVCWVHCELTDELQQAGQAVEQPLQRRWMETSTTRRQSGREKSNSDWLEEAERRGLTHHCPRLLVFRFQNA